MRQGEENDVRGLGQQLGPGFAEMEVFGAGMMANLGKTWATVWPANCREVTAANSTPGCRKSRRTNSSPE